MLNLKKETYLRALFFISTIVLLTAYIIQYLLGHQPCNLCLIERIPYALSLFILILNYKFKEDQIFYSVLLLLIFAFSFLISIYHYGIEQNLIIESNVCKSNDDVSLITKDEVLKSLQEINISCKDVTFKIFGLSLTSINIVVSLFFITTLLKIFNNYEKNK